MDAAIVWADGEQEGIPPLLQTWAGARGLRLTLPSEGGRHAVAVDPSVARSVEESLRQSRELLAQHDADGVERALAHAEGLVRAHPELPQAAWLLAEVQRGWASRFAQLDPIDKARAERHWSAAIALDGGRAPGLGEPSAMGATPVAYELDVTGSAEQLLLDGSSIATGSRQSRPGWHQLVATVSGDVVFAQWVAIAAGIHVRVALPTVGACSSADLSSPASIQCDSWVSARHDKRGFLVRSCSHATCGAELLVAPLLRATPDERVEHHKLPAWAAWTLAGTGAVALGVLVGIVTWFAVPPIEQTVFRTTKPE